MKKTSGQITRFSQSKLFEQYTKSNPITLVDVGARGGIHSRWDLVKGNINVLGFEPNLQECKRLNEKSGNNNTYFPIALFNRAGMLDINITNNPSCSSVYLPDSLLLSRFSIANDFKLIKSSTVRCETLHKILGLNNIQNVDFLKIDTQGSELQVLQGAKNALKNFIFGIDIEVEFSELYKEQPLFSDVDKYLKNNGFVFFDFIGSLGRVKRNKFSKSFSKGQVLWAHALYFKDFLFNKNINSNYLNFEKAIKAIAIAEIYEFSDFALELLDFYHNKEVIDNNVYENVRELLMKDRLSPENQLLKNVRSTISGYLKQRIPSFHNLIKKKLQ